MTARRPALAASSIAVLALVLASASGAGGAGKCGELIKGTPAADVLQGTPNPDLIEGLGGNDRLTGAGGSDCLEGGPDDDQLEGQIGNDRLSGDPGNDTLFGQEDPDQISGGAGEDTLLGGAEDDVVDGGTGDDRLREVGDGYAEGATFDTGSNLLRGGAGRDSISAANGRRDRVECGEGDDEVTADRIDDLKGCERRTDLVSPFPEVDPKRGNRGRSFMVRFRSLADTDRRKEFFAILVRGPGKCNRIASNSVGASYHRDGVVRYRLQPFSGNGRSAKRWCRGRYRGRVDFVQIEKARCSVRANAPPPKGCTDATRIGEFAFRVR
jgi:hypothetical protein